MGNIIRAIIYLGLIGTAAYYRYQYPNRYRDFGNPSSNTGTSTTIQSGEQHLTSGDTNSGDNSIIDQLAAQISGSMTASGTNENPFGSTYIVISEQTVINTGAILADGSICSAPWGKQVVGGHYTLAFKYDQDVDGACIIEKRICTQGILGGSYDQHTCYFRQNGGWYEYLGMTGYDSQQLIHDTEQKLGISSSNPITIGSSPSYTDDTKGSYNYSLIDANHIPAGKTNQGTYIDKTNSNGTNPLSNYELGPITPRTPEVKMNQSDSTRINQNLNGTQGIINNQGNKPTISYTTDNAKVESSGPSTSSQSCRTPRGTDVFHNQHVLAFKAKTVAQGQLCQSELRTCTYGYLRGSYQHETCTIIQSNNNDSNRIGAVDRDYRSDVRSYSNYYPQSCNVTNYGLLNNNSSLIMYRETKPAPGASCDGAVRTCQGGSLNGPSTHTALRCDKTEVICGDGRKDSSEQCDHKDTNKIGRGSQGCSLSCTTVNSVEPSKPPVCYDYTNTATLCQGQNGGTIKDKCDQVRSCPTVSTTLGKVQFMAWEEINKNREKNECELYISGISYTLVKCDSDQSLTPVQNTYTHVIDNVVPGSYQIIARPSVGAYRTAGYRPQRPDGRAGDPVDQTFRSHCFEVKSGETTHIRVGFQASMSIDAKTHPRWIFDPVNGQKEVYENPKCSL